MVEEEALIRTDGSEDSSDSSESTSLCETNCRRKKHFSGPKNETQCRLRRRVRNRRFLNVMLRYADTSSSDSDDTFTLQDSSDTEDDSEDSTSDSSATEHSDYSSGHERLISEGSSYATDSSDSSGGDSSSSHSRSSESDSYSESGCNSSDYETFSADDIDEYY